MQPEHGITTIDTGFYRPRFDASHLVVERGRAAFVDVGTNHSVPRLLAALFAQGLPASAVDYVILTHVHLDHAGGTGALLRELPSATLIVHPRGARHMIDPSALVAGASAVYGEDEVRRSYGELVPVPAERAVQAEDGHVIDLAGRPLLCLDTPGHARHHISIWDARSQAFFPGDTFGLSYREFDTARGPFILPTTSPVQFEPDALRASIDRMLGYAPQAMYLTHYSRVGDVPRLAEDLKAQIDAMVRLARAHAAAPDRHARLVAALTELYLDRARAHGCTLADAAMRELLGTDIELNAQGLEVWLERGARG
ncbi:MAG TPA: MBL fold metallo-hydrolase [Mizugakiibacter sp.]